MGKAVKGNSGHRCSLIIYFALLKSLLLLLFETKDELLNDSVSIFPFVHSKKLQFFPASYHDKLQEIGRLYLLMVGCGGRPFIKSILQG